MAASAFTHDGIEFRPLPSQGVYVGVGTYEGKPFLAYCAMLVDGSPDTTDGAPNWGEATNLDEDQAALDEVNALLGTAFPMSAFLGR